MWIGPEHVNVLFNVELYLWKQKHEIFKEVGYIKSNIAYFSEQL